MQLDSTSVRTDYSDYSVWKATWIPQALQNTPWKTTSTRHTLVAPGPHVRARRRRVRETLGHLREESLCICEPRQGIGEGLVLRVVLVAPEAVLESAALVHADDPFDARRLLRVDVFDEILCVHDCIVEVERVAPSDEDVELSIQLLPQLRPVALDDLRQVEIFAPILGDILVDLARQLVVDAAREPIFACWREHGLPDVPLAAGARVLAKNELAVVLLLHRRNHVAIWRHVARPGGARVTVSVTGQRRALELRIIKVGIVLLVQVDGSEVREGQGSGQAA